MLKPCMHLLSDQTIPPPSQHHSFISMQGYKCCTFQFLVPLAHCSSHSIQQHACTTQTSFIHVSVSYLKNKSVLSSDKILILRENYTGERVGVIYHYHKVQTSFFMCPAYKAWFCFVLYSRTTVNHCIPPPPPWCSYVN